jgi:DNA polymerase-3 subunit alpha
MFGAIEFYKTMKAENIKPIIGMEAYIHNNSELSDKTTKQRFHLCLYAKNDTGYKNLMYLSSKSYLDGFYYYPRINKNLLEEYSDGLICSTACLQGEVNWHLNTKNPRNVKFGAKGYESALEVALEYKRIFGDDFYLEIMRHGISDQKFIDKNIIKISKNTGIKIIATNDTHYLNKADAQSHEAFMCIAMGKELSDPNRLKHSVHEFYLKSPTQIQQLYADIPEAVENTQEIANKCNLEIKLGNPTPPNFKFVKEYSKADGVNFDDDSQYFNYRCEIGLKNRLKLVDKDKHHIYEDRLKFEIHTIIDMKFPGYMLIVWDFIKEAKRLNIPVGPGRGSAAGSLVAYVLEITDIDPIKYDLLFERFLNSQRVSMPDIDIDFCQANRYKIIDYVKEKYGKENVAQVITFGKLLAKGVIRDVARVLGVSYAKADMMAKLIPDEIGITLQRAYEKEIKLKELIETDENASEIWKHALRLEGLNRNAGMHAAGVVISNESLWKKTPLFKQSNEDTIVTQYNLDHLEDIDLIKFDFLGLKTLTVIDESKKLIKKRYDKDIDFNNCDINDKKLYDYISTGNTLGLFQIESDGMKNLNKNLKPSNFEDIIAVLALYRPGPMESGMLNDFIKRKHGEDKIDYFFDEFKDTLEPILKPTYGIIVYQEQVMQIVQNIGGFSLGEADIIRRAMGKKKVELMQKYNEEFSNRAEKRGYTRENASNLFSLIEKFAGYGFNKSHSAAYAMITFYTTYLKVYYPQEFLAALLTSEKDNTDKIVKYIDELKRLKLHLSPPNVNLSDYEFIAKKIDGKETILFGLGAIKGIGNAAIKSILDARKDGVFSSLNNFIERIDSSKVNKKTIESLIKSGGLDIFGHTRKSMLTQMEAILEASTRVSQAKKMAETSLFGDDKEMIQISLSLEDIKEYELKNILEFEKEILGFYVSGHPLDEFRENLEKVKYTLSSEIDEIGDGSNIILIGKIENIATKINKKGNKFFIVSILDLHGSIDMLVFDSIVSNLEKLDKNLPIAFKVYISKNGDFTRMKVNHVMSLEDIKNDKSKQKIKSNTTKKTTNKKIEPNKSIPVCISINIGDLEEIMVSVKDLAKRFIGARELILDVISNNQVARITTGMSVNDQILFEFKNIDKISILNESSTVMESCIMK